MKPGDILYNGVKASESFSKVYNALTARIESFEKAGKPAPHNLLNGRHYFLMSYCHCNN